MVTEERTTCVAVQIYNPLSSLAHAFWNNKHVPILLHVNFCIVWSILSKDNDKALWRQGILWGMHKQFIKYMHILII